MEGHSEGPVDSQESVHAQHEQENFTRQVVEELRRLTQPPPPPPPPVETPELDSNFGKLRRHGGQEFEGTTDPMVAEEWVKSIEQVFTHFKTQPTTQMKVRYATSLFLKDARNWWETLPGSQEEPFTMTWEEFLREFKLKYMPAIYQERKKLEFLELKQKEMFVAEYEQ